MEFKTKIVDGKKRVIITRGVSGVDKTKEAVLLVMKGYEYSKDKKDAI
jgi:hypothetical protein